MNKSKLPEIIRDTCRDLRINHTKAEKILWEYLRNRKLANKKFNRQFPIRYNLNNKESFFIADFYCDEAKLIIEVDGEIHDDKIEQDKFRTIILNSLGIKVIRFTNNEIFSAIKVVLDEIKNNLQ